MISSWPSAATKARAGAPEFSKLPSILSLDEIWNQHQRFRCPDMVGEIILESDMMRLLKATRAEVSGESLWNTRWQPAFRVAVDKKMLLA